MALAGWVCLGGGLRVVQASGADGVPARVRLDSAYLSVLVEEARTNHPGLRAAAHRVRAAERAVAGVRRWEDPSFRFGGVVASDEGPDLEMEGDLLLEVEQALPLFGKAQAMKREAQAGTAVAQADENLQFQLARRAVALAAHQLAFADVLVRIGQEDLALLERMTGFARERQRAGLDSALDLLRLENEREKRVQQLETDRRQRDFERATLNRLLGRSLDGPWPEFEQPELAPEIPFSERLFELGSRYEPQLQRMRQEIVMAEAGIEVTRRSRYPEVMLGVEGRQWSGSGEFREGMFTVGVNLPWFNRGKYRADLDRDRARAEAVRAEAQDYELDVRRELFRVWTRIDAARREALLYRDSILPRSEAAMQLAISGWTVGRGMFLDVLEARRMVTEARVMRARALNEQHQMIIELVTCCGVGELDSLEMLIPPGTAVESAMP